jgi:hypothetical protein
MLSSFDPYPVSSSTLINSRADYDLLFWAKRLGIPQEVLKGAIREVGNDLRDVERHLRQSAAADATRLRQQL